MAVDAILQVVAGLDAAAALGILHRDIKPDNFCMGVGDRSHVCYMIDFGLAKMYRNRDTAELMPMATGRRLAGTARYSSVWTHQGLSQGRRDDLEGLWYTLVYLARGSFPWDIAPVDVPVDQHIASQKKRATPESLCGNLEEPLRLFLVSFIGHVRSLEFQDEPDYDLLRSYCLHTLETLGASRNIESMFDFCWWRRRGGAYYADNYSVTSMDYLPNVNNASQSQGLSQSVIGRTAVSSMMSPDDHNASGTMPGAELRP